MGRGRCGARLGWCPIWVLFKECMHSFTFTIRMPPDVQPLWRANSITVRPVTICTSGRLHPVLDNQRFTIFHCCCRLTHAHTARHTGHRHLSHLLQLQMSLSGATSRTYPL